MAKKKNKSKVAKRSKAKSKAAPKKKKGPKKAARKPMKKKAAKRPAKKAAPKKRRASPATTSGAGTGSSSAPQTNLTTAVNPPSTGAVESSPTPSAEPAGDMTTSGGDQTADGVQ